MLATGAGSITEKDEEKVIVSDERLEMESTMGTENGFYKKRKDNECSMKPIAACLLRSVLKQTKIGWTDKYPQVNRIQECTWGVY